MGRFMSPDWSAKAEPVPYAKLDNPQSLNLYAYVGNNPLIRIDADGHCWPNWLCNAVVDFLEPLPPTPWSRRCFCTSGLENRLPRARRQDLRVDFRKHTQGLGQKCSSLAARSRRAASSGVISRCGMPSISKPTINLRTVAERSRGG